MEGAGGVAQEYKEAAVEEKKKQSRGAGGGGMKFRVSARAPHGVGALLLIGGAVLAGAAVVAWRRTRYGKRDRQQPAEKNKALDCGVVEEGKTGASAAPEIDLPDDKVEIDRAGDNLKAEEEEEERTKIGSNGSDTVRATEEIQEVQDDAEIVANEMAVSELVEKSVQEAADVSVKVDTENDGNSTDKSDDTENAEDATATNHIDQSDNSSKKETEKEMPANDYEDAEGTSDEHSRSVSRPGIVLLGKQSLVHGHDVQEAESMENSPTAKLMMHPEQLLDDNDMAMHAEKGEIAEAKVQPKALSPLVKPEKKEEPEERPERFETGMKIEQDYISNGEPKQHHDLISNGGAGAMDRRRSSSSVAVLALMFALMTVGIAIVVRLYAPSLATKLQINLQ